MGVYGIDSLLEPVSIALSRWIAV